ncbi:Tetratricopeptide repeat family protein [Granulibacter bethesdensis]|nr:Tetratricopeptide repeat family protein [Granulibacter bethesdensis]
MKQTVVYSPAADDSSPVRRDASRDRPAMRSPLMDTTLDRNRVLAAHGHHEGLLFALNAIEATPSYGGHYLQLGNLLASLGDHSAASTALGRAESLLGADFSDMHEGLLFAGNAIKASPDYAGGYVRLGNLLHALGQKAEAADAFRTALRIDPKGLDAQRFLNLAEGKVSSAAKPVAQAAASHAAPSRTTPHRPAAPAPKEGFFRRLLRGLFGG